MTITHQADPEAKLKFTQQRDQVVHTLGNLTLITGSLNPSLSNGSWQKKRPELAKYSKLNLNRYFYPVHEGEDPLLDWSEDSIRERGRVLFQAASSVWPY
ncbi:HNH endonuclease family protein [Marinobacter lutaoensis]|uniref:HNH endonuclease family protein n=1 Tax=Marinobacter lutaoensis TaxID=135739 RepID=UPI0020CD86B1|nr:HNH endonuclease family protein [Marinobacter lutaoensis]